jgi:hypothetical protein
MKPWQAAGVLSGVLLTLGVSDGLALENRRSWTLGPQEQSSYDQPGSNRARDILDNRFEGRRPAREEGSYDQQPPLGPDGQVMDEASRLQWEKEQRIRGFRQQRQEEYGSTPDQKEEETENLEEQDQAQPGPDDAAWQEELRRRNPLSPETRPRY